MASTNLTTEFLNRANVQILQMMRTEAWIGQKVQALLNELELDLIRKLEQIVGKDPISIGRLKVLLAQTRNLIEGTYKKIDKSSIKSLGKVAEAASYQVAKMVNVTTGVDLMSVAMSASQLESMAADTVVMGRYMNEWWEKQSLDLFQKFTMQMRVGMLQGESVPQLMQRVRGTRANNFTDGLFRIPSHQAQALVRTSTVSMGNMGRLQTMVDNKDVLNGIQWVATLDDRTCEICMALDGVAWALPDENAQQYGDYSGLAGTAAAKQFPGPTAHISCRCAQVPIVKSFKELLGTDAVKDDPSLIEIDKEKRASMDGQTGETTGFEEWLKGKDTAFQDEALGSETAQLWRDDKIDLRDLTTTTNTPLSPDELRTVAGLPPKIPTSSDYWKNWNGITDAGALNAHNVIMDEAKEYVNAMAAYNSAQLQPGEWRTYAESNRMPPTFNAGTVAGSRLEKAHDAAVKAYEAYQTESLPKIHEALAVENPSTNMPELNVSAVDAKELPDLKAATEQALTNMRSITDPELFDALKEVNVDGVLAMKTPLATANYDFTQNQINVLTGFKRPPKALMQSVIHELTHQLQYATGHWKDELAFWEMRGGKAFKWMDGYMDRSYPFGTAVQMRVYPHPFGNWSPREMVTTAMEYYWFRPEVLAMRDPQLFEFVYKLLHNTL